MSTLPTWSDIFYITAYEMGAVPNKSVATRCLEMMQEIENAGHGDSVERYLLDLALTYGYDRADLKARVLDMLYGDYAMMYSYQGWETLTTRTDDSIGTPKPNHTHWSVLKDEITETLDNEKDDLEYYAQKPNHMNGKLIGWVEALEYVLGRMADLGGEKE